MRRVSLTLLAVFVTGAVAPVPAHAAASPWRQVRATELRGEDELEAVVAVSAKNAWAFGTRPVVVPLKDGSSTTENKPTAFHWDGRKWKRTKLPSGLARSSEPGSWNHYSPSGLSASNGRNAWAVTLDSDGPPRVLKWTGSAWRISEIASKGGVVLAVAAYGKDKAVAFGRGGRTWLYAKGHWRKGKTLPFPVQQATSDGRRVYVQTVVKRRLTVARLDGEAWRTLPATGVVGASLDPFRTFQALPDGRLVVSVVAQGKAVFLTWKDGRWTRDGAVTDRWAMRCPASDGHGGLWTMSAGVEAMADQPATLWHRDAAGTWTRRWRVEPSDDEPEGVPDACAGVPGTRTVLGVGSTHAGWDVDGSIMKLVLT